MRSGTVRLHYENSNLFLKFNLKAPSNLESRDWLIANTENGHISNIVIDHNNNTNEEECTRAAEQVNFDATQYRQTYVSEVLHIIRPISHCKKFHKKFHITNQLIN